MRIIFNEELHKYYLEGSDKVFTSVSKFLETFTDKFDEDIEAEKFVSSKNNKLGLKSKEEVLAYWKLRRDLGTALHAKYENADLENGAHTYQKDDNGHKICYTTEELQNLPVGIHTELTIHMFSAWLIGTADYIEIFPDKTFIIKDYKSNGNKLVETPKKYFDKKKGFADYKYFKFPLTNRPCDTFQKYTYQLSTYAYFLELMGYTCKGMEIIAIEMNDKGEEVSKRIMPVEYRKDDVIKMINYYKKVRK